jgi:hypothetical protein
LASRKSTSSRSPGGLSALADQLVERILRPLGLVILSRARIQETLEEAAQRGRLTRSDANDLAALLIQRGRQQTDELLPDIDRLLGRGRQQLDSATVRARRSKPVYRIVRRAERARRAVGAGPSFPIMAYDELTVPQVRRRLADLNPAELRKVRDYERRHANRKTILTSVEKRLG